MVLAGKRAKGKQNDNDRLSDIWGNVHVPNGFGDEFEYSVPCFGNFTQYKEGIATYIYTLCVGAKAAIEACRNNNFGPSAMICSSSHKLCGLVIPNCNLIASPIAGDCHFVTSSPRGAFQDCYFDRISQKRNGKGDLDFRGGELGGKNCP